VYVCMQAGRCMSMSTVSLRLRGCISTVCISPEVWGRILPNHARKWTFMHMLRKPLLSSSSSPDPRTHRRHVPDIQHPKHMAKRWKPRCCFCRFGRRTWEEKIRVQQIEEKKQIKKCPTITFRFRVFCAFQESNFVPSGGAPKTNNLLEKSL